MRHLHVPALLIVLLAGSLALTPPLALAQDADANAAPLVLLRGIVRDDAGHPLADVEVSANGWSEKGESFDVATTDSNGTFELRVHEGRVHVSAWSRELHRGADQGLEVTGNETFVELTIPRPPPRDAIVTGVVRGSDGEPLPGARVTLNAGCCFAYPAGDSAGPDAATSEQAKSEDSTDEARVASSEPMIMPAPCCYDGDHQERFTDSEGRFRFETYAGPRQVTAHAKGYAQTSITVHAVANDTVEADLTLEKIPDADAVLSGRVVDSETGLPVAGANVWLNNLEWSTYDHTTTGADGSFRFTTIPGWVQVSISADRHCCGRVEALETDAVSSSETSKPMPPTSGAARDYRPLLLAFGVETGTQERTFKLMPKPEPSVILTGYVVDPATETGVEGAWVNVWNQDTGDWGQAKTDATGSYRILVRPGYHQVTAWKEGHLNGAGTILVEEGDATKRHDVLMPRGTPKNTGCWGCHGGEYAMTADGDAAATREMTPMAAEESAPTDATFSEGTAGGANGADATKASGRETSGSATYEGSGGGLPPYQATNGDTSATTSTGEEAPRTENATPGLGLAALLAAAGLVALARARRRG